MKNFLQLTIATLSLFLFSASSWAGSVDIPNAFTAGTTAVAADVNANFGALETAVDDNDGRITTNSTDIAALQATIATLQDTVADLQAALAGKTDVGHGHAQSDVTDLATDIVPNLGTYLSITTDANGYETALFTGVNVQVLNGINQEALNGLGNLIVGYNLARTANNVCSDGQYDNQTDCENASETWARDHKSGSHNLVVGSANGYSQYGGVVFGYQNAINRALAGVTGGEWNTASGYYSSVSGGYLNTAIGSGSSVSGGISNTTSGLRSSVSGGNSRTASGSYNWAAGSLFEDN